MKGWVKIDRAIMDHWIAQDAEWLKWWFDLIIMAAHTRIEKAYKGIRYTLQPGQVHASLEFLAKRWNRHRDTVRAYLRVLEKNDMVSRCVFNGSISIITICKYVDYQLPDNESINPSTNPSTNIGTDDETNIGTDDETNIETDAETNGEFDGENEKRSTQNKNNNTHTQIIGPQEFLKFLSEEQASRMYVEQTAMALHVAADRLREMAAQFVSEMQSREKGYMGLADLKNHFFNWARIEIQKQEQQKRYNNGTKNNANNGNGGAARRAGSGITPRVYGLKE